MKARLSHIWNQARALMAGSSATKHAIAVSSGAIAAQLIALLAGPINSRLYTPAEYGTLAILSTMLSLSSIISTMRLDMAVPVAEDDNEAMRILLVCVVSSLAWTLVACLMCLFARGFTTKWLFQGNPYFYRYIWFYPVGLLAYSITTMLTAWAVRRRDFVNLSLTRVIQNTYGSGGMVVLGFLHCGTLGLLAANTLSILCGLSKLFRSAYAFFQECRSTITSKVLLETFKTHYRYPLFTTSASFVNTFSAQVPIIFLSHLFSAGAAGYFSLCNRVLTLPATVVGSAVSPVFFSRIKQAHQEGNLKEMTLRMLDSVVGIHVFFMVFLALFGEAAISFVFGARWARSGQYASALVPWLLLQFVSTPLENIPLLFKRQATLLVFQGSLLALRVGSMFLGLYWKSDLMAMVWFGALSGLYLLVFMAWVLHLIDIPLWRPFKKLCSELLLALLMLGACRLVMAYTHNPYLTLACLVPTLAYGAYRSVTQLLRGRIELKAEKGTA